MRAVIESIRNHQGKAILTFFGMLAVLSPSGWSQQPGDRKTRVLTTVSQVRTLSAAEARRKYRIHLEGVITYGSPEYGVTFFQDRTAGIFVFTEHPDSRLTAGAAVEVEGTTAPGDFAPSIDHPKIRT